MTVETSASEENVWFLRLFGNRRARYGFTADELEIPDSKAVLAIFGKYFQSEPVEATDFPNRFWIDPPTAGARGSTLPPAHVASMFVVVSREFLDVLQQFDLGTFVSWPVALLKKDKQTPFEGEWFAVWIGNRKTGFVREKSTSFEIPPHKDFGWLSVPNMDAVDGDFVMDASVLDGPDIWRETTLEYTLMLSDRLHTALNDAGLLQKIKVLRCPVAR